MASAGQVGFAGSDRADWSYGPEGLVYIDSSGGTPFLFVCLT